MSSMMGKPISGTGGFSAPEDINVAVCLLPGTVARLCPSERGHAGSDVIASPERPVLMEYVDDEATQKRFYEALLK
jgi:hypothetical protein